MREIRTSGSMSGEWKRGMVGYSGTGRRKGRQHARPHLNHRATPRLYSPPSVLFKWAPKTRSRSQPRPPRHEQPSGIRFPRCGPLMAASAKSIGLPGVQWQIRSNEDTVGSSTALRTPPPFWQDGRRSPAPGSGSRVRRAPRLEERLARGERDPSPYGGNGRSGACPTFPARRLRRQQTAATARTAGNRDLE